jgi:hypothetical protein
MVVPAQRWQPSPRAFQANRREWEYPVGWEAYRLAGEGQLSLHGKRWR